MSSFEFDSAKASGNLRKHGVSFADAEGVFEDPLALHRTDPDSAGEQRFVAVGLSRTQKVVVVVYSLRGTSVRLISARRATRRETKFYAG